MQKNISKLLYSWLMFVDFCKVLANFCNQFLNVYLKLSFANLIVLDRVLCSFDILHCWMLCF